MDTAEKIRLVTRPPTSEVVTIGIFTEAKTLDWKSGKYRV